MNLKDQLQEIKSNVHAGNDITGSMDNLQKVVNSIYDDPTEREMMINMVIDTKHDLLKGHPISTFDATYLMIVQGLGYSGKV